VAALRALMLERPRHRCGFLGTVSLGRWCAPSLVCLRPRYPQRL